MSYLLKCCRIFSNVIQLCVFWCTSVISFRYIYRTVMAPPIDIEDIDTTTDQSSNYTGDVHSTTSSEDITELHECNPEMAFSFELPENEAEVTFTLKPGVRKLSTRCTVVGSRTLFSGTCRKATSEHCHACRSVCKTKTSNQNERRDFPSSRSKVKVALCETDEKTTVLELAKRSNNMEECSKAEQVSNTVEYLENAGDSKENFNRSHTKKTEDISTNLIVIEKPSKGEEKSNNDGIMTKCTGLIPKPDQKQKMNELDNLPRGRNDIQKNASNTYNYEKTTPCLKGKNARSNIKLSSSKESLEHITQRVGNERSTSRDYAQRSVPKSKVNLSQTISKSFNERDNTTYSAVNVNLKRDGTKSNNHVNCVPQKTSKSILSVSNSKLSISPKSSHHAIKHFIDKKPSASLSETISPLQSTASINKKYSKAGKFRKDSVPDKSPSTHIQTEFNGNRTSLKDMVRKSSTNNDGRISTNLHRNVNKNSDRNQEYNQQESTEETSSEQEVETTTKAKNVKESEPLDPLYHLMLKLHLASKGLNSVVENSNNSDLSGIERRLIEQITCVDKYQQILESAKLIDEVMNALAKKTVDKQERKQLHIDLRRPERLMRTVDFESETGGSSDEVNNTTVDAIERSSVQERNMLMDESDHLITNNVKQLSEVVENSPLESASQTEQSSEEIVGGPRLHAVKNSFQIKRRTELKKCNEIINLNNSLDLLVSRDCEKTSQVHFQEKNVVVQNHNHAHVANNAELQRTAKQSRIIDEFATYVNSRTLNRNGLDDAALEKNTNQVKIKEDPTNTTKQQVVSVNKAGDLPLRLAKSAPNPNNSISIQEVKEQHTTSLRQLLKLKELLDTMIEKASNSSIDLQVSKRGGSNGKSKKRKRFYQLVDITSKVELENLPHNLSSSKEFSQLATVYNDMCEKVIMMEGKSASDNSSSRDTSMETVISSKKTLISNNFTGGETSTYSERSSSSSRQMSLGSSNHPSVIIDQHGGRIILSRPTTDKKVASDVFIEERILPTDNQEISTNKKKLPANNYFYEQSNTDQSMKANTVRYKMVKINDCEIVSSFLPSQLVTGMHEKEPKSNTLKNVKDINRFLLKKRINNENSISEEQSSRENTSSESRSSNLHSDDKSFRKRNTNLDTSNNSINDSVHVSHDSETPEVYSSYSETYMCDTDSDEYMEITYADYPKNAMFYKSRRHNEPKELRRVNVHRCGKTPTEYWSNENELSRIPIAKQSVTQRTQLPSGHDIVEVPLHYYEKVLGIKKPEVNIKKQPHERPASAEVSETPRYAETERNIMKVCYRNITGGSKTLGKRYIIDNDDVIEEVVSQNWPMHVQEIRKSLDPHENNHHDLVCLNTLKGNQFRSRVPQVTNNFNDRDLMSNHQKYRFRARRHQNSADSHYESEDIESYQGDGCSLTSTGNHEATLSLNNHDINNQYNSNKYVELNQRWEPQRNHMGGKSVMSMSIDGSTSSKQHFNEPKCLLNTNDVVNSVKLDVGESNKTFYEREPRMKEDSPDEVDFEMDCENDESDWESECEDLEDDEECTNVRNMTRRLGNDQFGGMTTVRTKGDTQVDIDSQQRNWMESRVTDLRTSMKYPLKEQDRVGNNGRNKDVVSDLKDKKMRVSFEKNSRTLFVVASDETLCSAKDLDFKPANKSAQNKNVNTTLKKIDERQAVRNKLLKMSVVTLPATKYKHEKECSQENNKTLQRDQDESDEWEDCVSTDSEDNSIHEEPVKKINSVKTQSQLDDEKFFSKFNIESILNNRHNMMKRVESEEGKSQTSDRRSSCGTLKNSSVRERSEERSFNQCENEMNVENYEHCIAGNTDLSSSRPSSRKDKLLSKNMCLKVSQNSHKSKRGSDTDTNKISQRGRNTSTMSVQGKKLIRKNSNFLSKPNVTKLMLDLPGERKKSCDATSTMKQEPDFDEVLRKNSHTTESENIRSEGSLREYATERNQSDREMQQENERDWETKQHSLVTDDNKMKSVRSQNEPKGHEYRPRTSSASMRGRGHPRITGRLRGGTQSLIEATNPKEKLTFKTVAPLQRRTPSAQANSRSVSPKNLDRTIAPLRCKLNTKENVRCERPKSLVNNASRLVNSKEELAKRSVSADSKKSKKDQGIRVKQTIVVSRCEIKNKPMRGSTLYPGDKQLKPKTVAPQKRGTDIKTAKICKDRETSHKLSTQSAKKGDQKNLDKQIKSPDNDLKRSRSSSPSSKLLAVKSCSEMGLDSGISIKDDTHVSNKETGAKQQKLVHFVLNTENPNDKAPCQNITRLNLKLKKKKIPTFNVTYVNGRDRVNKRRGGSNMQLKMKKSKFDAYSSIPDIADQELDLERKVSEHNLIHSKIKGHDSNSARDKSNERIKRVGVLVGRKNVVRSEDSSNSARKNDDFNGDAFKLSKMWKENEKKYNLEYKHVSWSPESQIDDDDDDISDHDDFFASCNVSDSNFNMDSDAALILTEDKSLTEMVHWLSTDTSLNSVVPAGHVSDANTYSVNDGDMDQENSLRRELSHSHQHCGQTHEDDQEEFPNDSTLDNVVTGENVEGKKSFCLNGKSWECYSSTSDSSYKRFFEEDAELNKDEASFATDSISWYLNEKESAREKCKLLKDRRSRNEALANKDKLKTGSSSGIRDEYSIGSVSREKIETKRKDRSKSPLIDEIKQLLKEKMIGLSLKNVEKDSDVKDGLNHSKCQSSQKKACRRNELVNTDPRIRSSLSRVKPIYDKNLREVSDKNNRLNQSSIKSLTSSSKVSKINNDQRDFGSEDRSSRQLASSDTLRNKYLLKRRNRSPIVCQNQSLTHSKPFNDELCIARDDNVKFTTKRTQVTKIPSKEFDRTFLLDIVKPGTGELLDEIKSRTRQLVASINLNGSDPQGQDGDGGDQLGYDNKRSILKENSAPFSLVESSNDGRASSRDKRVTFELRQRSKEGVGRVGDNQKALGKSLKVKKSVFRK